MALWLLMSGLFKPLLIGLGVISCLLCTWIVHRLGLPAKSGGLLDELKLVSTIRYLFWLVVEIGKADWLVTKVILDPKMALQQRLIKVPAGEASDIAKATFANSITLTPGTVTVETERDHFIVHALTDETADMGALEAMNRRVIALEKIGGSK